MKRAFRARGLGEEFSARMLHFEDRQGLKPYYALLD